MSILRSDVQVALNDLHMALQQSADYYHFAADYLKDAPAGAVCEQLAAARDDLAKQAVAAIRATGELPSEPDRDRETTEELRERLASLLARDAVTGVLNHRLEAEKTLRAFLDSDALAPLESGHAQLLKDCQKSNEHALDVLTPLVSA